MANNLTVDNLHEERLRTSTASKELDVEVVSDRYKHLSIIGLVGDNAACAHYRLINPLLSFKRHGAKVHFSTMLNMRDIYDHDWIVAPRQHSESTYELLRMAALDNKVVISELDDDLESVLPDSPAYIAYHPGAPEITGLIKCIKASHGMTVSTPELKRWVGQYNENIAVVPNHIDFSLRDWNVDVTWRNGYPIFTPKPIIKPEEWGDKKVILYSGGSTHLPDLEYVGPTLRKILNERSDTILVMYSSLEIMNQFIGKHRLPADKILHQPARHFVDHPIGMFGADIQLAPLHPCQFNQAKSPLKMMEAMSAGSVVIASNLAPYSRFYTQNPLEGVALVGKGKRCFSNWYDAITTYLNHPNLDKLRAENRKYAIDNFSLEDNHYLWYTAWSSIVQNAKQGVCGSPETLYPRAKYKTFGSTKPNDQCPCGSGLLYKDCCVEAF